MKNLTPTVALRPSGHGRRRAVPQASSASGALLAVGAQFGGALLHRLGRATLPLEAIWHGRSASYDALAESVRLIENGMPGSGDPVSRGSALAAADGSVRSGMGPAGACPRPTPTAAMNGQIGRQIQSYMRAPTVVPMACHRVIRDSARGRPGSAAAERAARPRKEDARRLPVQHRAGRSVDRRWPYAPMKQAKTLSNSGKLM